MEGQHSKPAPAPPPTYGPPPPHTHTHTHLTVPHLLHHVELNQPLHTLLLVLDCEQLILTSCTGKVKGHLNKGRELHKSGPEPTHTQLGGALRSPEPIHTQLGGKLCIDKHTHPTHAHTNTHALAHTYTHTATHLVQADHVPDVADPVLHGAQVLGLEGGTHATAVVVPTHCQHDAVKGRSRHMCTHTLVSDTLQ
jgi:hypothetical protein